MADLIAEGAKEGLNLATGAVKGFLGLLAIGVGALVVRFGATVVLDVMEAGIELIKTVIA